MVSDKAFRFFGIFYAILGCFVTTVFGVNTAEKVEPDNGKLCFYLAYVTFILTELAFFLSVPVGIMLNKTKPAEVHRKMFVECKAFVIFISIIYAILLIVTLAIGGYDSTFNETILYLALILGFLGLSYLCIWIMNGVIAAIKHEMNRPNLLQPDTDAEQGESNDVIIVNTA